MGQRCGAIEEEAISTSSAWHDDSGTDGHEGPYGVESVSKRSIGIVCLHGRVCAVCLRVHV